MALKGRFDMALRYVLKNVKASGCRCRIFINVQFCHIECLYHKEVTMGPGLEALPRLTAFRNIIIKGHAPLTIRGEFSAWSANVRSSLAAGWLRPSANTQTSSAHLDRNIDDKALSLWARPDNCGECHRRCSRVGLESAGFTLVAISALVTVSFGTVGNRSNGLFIISPFIMTSHHLLYIVNRTTRGTNRPCAKALHDSRFLPLVRGLGR